MGIRVVWKWKDEWTLVKKWDSFYKPLKKEGIATKLILSFIPESELALMMRIYYSLSFMLAEFGIYPYPVDRLNAISKELGKINFLSIEERGEIIDFIVKKIEKALKRQTKIAGLYRQSCKLKRSEFRYKYNFPDKFLSEMKQKENFPLYCLLYFFDYSLPDVITNEEIQKRIKMIETDEGIEFGEFSKLTYTNARVLRASLNEKDNNEGLKVQENLKWVLVSYFIHEQFGLVKDKEELIKALKRYARYIASVYQYIYHNFPHREFVFLTLPDYSGKYIFDEKGNYKGTIFTFF